MPAHDRDGRVQLVTDVLQQLPLRHDALIEPVEHLVDGLRHARDVVATGDGNPLIEVRGRDALRHRAHLADRPQQATRDPHADHDDEQHDHDRSDHEDAGRVVQLGELALEVVADDVDDGLADGAVVGGDRDGHREVADRALIARERAHHRVRAFDLCDHAVDEAVESLQLHIERQPWHDGRIAVHDAEDARVVIEGRSGDDRTEGLFCAGPGVVGDRKLHRLERGAQVVVDLLELTLAVDEVGRSARDKHADERQQRDDAHDAGAHGYRRERETSLLGC